MNTVGKILVILNLIFAVVVAAFLALDFAARSDNANKLNSLKREMAIAHENTKTILETTRKLTNQLTQSQKDLDDKKADLVTSQIERKAKEEELLLAIQDAKNQAKNTDLNLQVAKAEQQRLIGEVAQLSATVKTRDQTIIAFEKSITEYRSLAIAKENENKILLVRTEELSKRIQELETNLARINAGVGKGTGLAKDPNQPNPPSTYVKGTIEKVHPKDTSMVQLSVGSDHGVREDHTLEVFRVDPPTYLGTIRILESRPHESFGRLIPGASGSRKQLQVGDTVATSLKRGS